MKKQTKIVNIPLASKRLAVLGFVVFIVLLLTGILIISQEDPSSDAGVIQGVFFGGIAFTILALGSIALNCIVCLILRKLNLESFVSFSLFHILVFLIPVAIVLFKIWENPVEDWKTASVELVYLIGIFVFVMTCNLLAGFLFWILGTKWNEEYS